MLKPHLIPLLLASEKSASDFLPVFVWFLPCWSVRRGRPSW